MTDVYPLVELLTRLSATTFLPFFPSWEMCALKLINAARPSAVYFFCKYASHCPSKDFYKKIQNVPSQTLFRLETDRLPTLKRSDMVFMLDDFAVWDNTTVENYRWHGKNDFKIIFVMNRSKKQSRDRATMASLFEALWRSGIVSSAVIRKNDTYAQIYTYVPFKSKTTCEDTTPMLLGECKKAVTKVFDLTHKVYNFNGCPLRVSVFNDKPFVSYPLSGRLSSLIVVVASALNATLVTMHGEKGSNCGPMEYTGVKAHVIEGRAHLAFGASHREPCSVLSYLHLSHTTCLAWCTPLISNAEYIYAFIIGLFQPNVWAAFLVTSSAVILSVLLLRLRTNERHSTHHVFGLAFAFFAQVDINFRSSPLRLIVAMWLVASLVLRTAYEAELKSWNAVPVGSERIEDLESLWDEELELCSVLDNIESLKVDDDPLSVNVYKNTHVCKGSTYDNVMLAAVDKDRAVFTSEIRCQVIENEISVDKPTLFSRTGGCWKLYQMAPIVTMPGSPFGRRWSEIQERCIEAGLMKKWLSLNPPHRDKGRVRRYSLKHLLPSLFVLAIGCLVAFVIFLTEAVFKWPF